ncbi:response regulator [Leptospira kanakyensis]|uniref:response regulator n=1 Tax=Leptospira kanakyensis TaxID=2484968 RepID=UPI00223D8182|nr:response regulator [Leptospira kanakyensis]MCW7470297.1 response regulator [Leptospira kanakyensis]
MSFTQLQHEKNAILCVDDEPILLLSLVQELKREIGGSYTYETAQNPEEAMEVIDDLCSSGVEVILILSDWLMPGMRGDEFLIQVHQKYPQIKSILISGHADRDAINRVKEEAKTYAIFSKPWNTRELLDAVRFCCNLT